MGDDILDFDQQIAEEYTTSALPVAFRFHGQIFKAHGDGPGMVLLDFVRAASGTNNLATVDAMLSFLEACMPAEEFARFRAICYDPEIVTPVEHLGVVVRGLLRSYSSDRPTGPSSPSPNGQSSTGTGSQDGSSATASAPEA